MLYLMLECCGVVSFVLCFFLWGTYVSPEKFDSFFFSFLQLLCMGVGFFFVVVHDNVKDFPGSAVIDNFMNGLKVLGDL